MKYVRKEDSELLITLITLFTMARGLETKENSLRRFPDPSEKRRLPDPSDRRRIFTDPSERRSNP